MQLEDGLVAVGWTGLQAHWPDGCPAGACGHVACVRPAQRHLPAVGLVLRLDPIAAEQRGQRMRAAASAPNDQKVGWSSASVDRKGSRCGLNLAGLADFAKQAHCSRLWLRRRLVGSGDHG